MRRLRTVMTTNPFEPPKSEAEPVFDGRRFDLRLAVRDAWRAVIGDIGVVIMGSLMFVSIGLAATVTVLGIFLFLPVLVWGGVRLLLNLVDGIAGYTDLGDGFPRYGSVLGRTFLLGLLFALPLLPVVALYVAAASLQQEAFLFAGQLALLVTWFGLMPRFAFAPFIMVDQDLGASEAMAASWRTTADHKGRASLLVFLSALIATAGLGCFVLAVVAVPVAFVMFAAAYRQMFPKP